MKTSPAGRKFISREEGNILTAYTDSVGVWTIGVGHTSAAGLPKVSQGMKITAQESDEILSRDLAAVEKQVLNVVKVPLTQNQFDALVSLTFNIGPTAFGNSTLVKLLNKKDYKGAADQFLVWNKGTINGKKVAIKGLTNRRARERTLFVTPDVNFGPDPIVKPVEAPIEVPKVEVPETKETPSTSFLDIIIRIIKAIFK